jgi:hypothetical protein
MAYPSVNACNAGMARQTSLQSAARTRFLRPVFLTAATNSPLSQAFMLERAMGVRSENTSSSCGVMRPLNPFDSTAVKMTGRPKIFAALASTSTLLSKSCRSMLATPKNICGWWSMKMTTPFSGVNRPLSVELALIRVHSSFLDLQEKHDSPRGLALLAKRTHFSGCERRTCASSFRTMAGIGLDDQRTFCRALA